MKSSAWRGAILIGLGFGLIAGGVLPASAQRQVPEEYIVVLRDTVEKGPGMANRFVRAHRGRVLHDYTIVNGFAARIPATQLERLRSDPRVKYVEPNFLAFAPPAGRGPKNGGGTESPPETTPTGLIAIRATESQATGAGIHVAVIDTGIDLDHPDLAANLRPGADFTNSRKGANDDNGHGSHVAGTIAAVRGNGIGVVGVAPEATLHPVKVLDRKGRGSYARVIAGIDWAWKNGMDVGNLSLGGSEDSQALHDALRAGAAAGVIWIVAAGNDGRDAATVYPAAYDDAVITVSANWWEDDSAGGARFAGWPTFSNFGSPVDISAPGVYVKSTWKSGGYEMLSGTSMAAPHVTGVVALLLQLQPGYGFADVRSTLISGALDVPNVSTHPEEMVDAGDY